MKLLRRTFKKKSIPPSRDPIANYPLPPLTDFLKDAAGLKYIRKNLTSTCQTENLECYEACVKYAQDPSKGSAQNIWDKFIKSDASDLVNLPADMVDGVSAGLKKDKTPADLFSDVQQETLQMIESNCWTNFRSTKEFDQWLWETKQTTPSQLKKQWWKTNKKTKWGNVGKKSSSSAKAQAYEHAGNIITRSSTLPPQKNKLDGKYALVFWPEDNVTRLCHILGYIAKTDCYKVTYMFDNKVYDEHFDTDWKLLEVQKSAALDYGSDTQSALSREPM